MGLIGGIETVGSQEAKAKLLQMIGQGNNTPQEEKIPKDDDPTEVSNSSLPIFIPFFNWVWILIGYFRFRI